MQAVGRVYVYKYPAMEPLAILNGTSEFEQFGYDFDLSNQLKGTLIAISSLTKDSKLDNRQNAFVSHRGGVVNLFYLGNEQPVATIKSDRSYSGFGSKIKVSLYKSSNFSHFVL